MPEVVIIAGPNGAGKTTFASEYLPAARRHLEFVNADEIARAVSRPGLPQQQSDRRAARMMLERIDDLVRSGADFMFETTLATLTYARKIPLWRKQGYTVSLIYLRLPSVDASLARVRKRVAAGGHGIPEVTIRRRFGKSASYFETTYKSVVDEWYIWDSFEGAFVLTESWDRA
ncbi:MAG: AAA family ATPase [Rhizobiales bacterium]|nr:AAA family ATPase [Hyphomicrobiales bacterium]